jgi:hypothetical protein
MFGFFKKKPAPVACPANPGRTHEFRVALTGDWGSRTENVNAVTVLAATMKKHRHTVKSHGNWLEHPDSGFSILPQLVELVPLDDGGVRTISTVQVNHPTLVPNGVFEFQHAAGSTAEQSLANAFEGWTLGDFVALTEAVRDTPGQCMTMIMELPASNGHPGRKRRVILGPVAHYRQNPPASEEEHPFCPCCMLTQSAEAFKEVIDVEDFRGLRFYSARDDAGQAMADCRVNGEDFERGIQALREYASTWPTAGYEFRRQFVVVHTLK